MCWKRNGRNKENNDSSALSKQYCLIGTKIVNLFFLIFRPCCKRRIKPTTISKVFHCFALWYFHLIFLAMFEICNFSLDFFSLFSYPSDQTSIFWDHSSWSRGLSPVGWLPDTCHNWIYPLHSPPMLLIPIHFLIAFLFFPFFLSLFFSLVFAPMLWTHPFFMLFSFFVWAIQTGLYISEWKK